MRGATPYVCERSASCQISIHAPHARSDSSSSGRAIELKQFQSTLLMRGATGDQRKLAEAMAVFQSTLLMRGATPHVCLGCLHAYFNPRSSCEERRPLPAAALTADRHFNPRSSCEERPGRRQTSRRATDFNPRSSCEERRRIVEIGYESTNFNPRSSCEERRRDGLRANADGIFQSTHLMRGATPHNSRCSLR